MNKGVSFRLHAKLTSLTGHRQPQMDCQPNLLTYLESKEWLSRKSTDGGRVRPEKSVARRKDGGFAVNFVSFQLSILNSCEARKPSKDKCVFTWVLRWTHASHHHQANSSEREKNEIIIHPVLTILIGLIVPLSSYEAYLIWDLDRLGMRTETGRIPNGSV